jgi:hypothetical protein
MTSPEPHVANHYTHFLRRLDRVTEDHLELAMALYTDHELLRLVLERAQAPQGCDRLAIALGPVHEGPFVVVTRRGAFVTCLGQHMRPKDMPIVRRAQLDIAMRDLDGMRVRQERVRRLEAEAEDASTIRRLRAIDLGSPSLAREDFLELARWDALLGDATHRTFLGTWADCTRTASTVARIRTDRRSKCEDTLLHAFWRAYWTASHMHVLANVGDVYARCDRIEQGLRGRIDHSIDVLTAVAPAIQTPFVEPMARGAWASLRHVRGVLDLAKRTTRAELYSRMLRDSSLVAIAMGSRCGRDEALSLLRHAPPEAVAPFEEEYQREVVPFFRDAIRDPEQALDEFTLAAQERVAAERGGDPRDVSPDTARALAVTGLGDWTRDAASKQLLVRALPWLAAADASELFAPRSECVKIAYTPERAIGIATSLVRAQRNDEPGPVRRTAAPERNDRCPCASGQKYKVCCMRRTRAA